MTVTTDSTSPGYLRPVSPAVEDDALENILSAAIVGVTGLDPTMVMPAYPDQPEASGYLTNFTRPAPDVSWAMFTVTSADPVAARAEVTHDGADAGGLGTSTVEQMEWLVVLASFYGPSAQTYVKMLRDGLMVAQNRDVLRAAGLALRDVSNVTSVPELSADTNQQPQRRWDAQLTFMRHSPRTYAVENLLRAEGSLLPSSGPAATGFITPTADEGP